MPAISPICSASSVAVYHLTDALPHAPGWVEHGKTQDLEGSILMRSRASSTDRPPVFPCCIKFFNLRSVK